MDSPRDAEEEEEEEEEEYAPPSQPPESYNGAEHDNFVWSQSISDLDVIVRIPDTPKSLSDLRVELSSGRMRIETRQSPRDDWTAVLEGQLSFPTKSNESLWSLVAGESLHIHLEKCRERWWEALMVGEKKINLEGMDRSRDFHDLSQEERMKIAQLVWNERKKITRTSSCQ